MIRELVILGGGSAGFLAALTLKSKIPQLSVRLIRSPDLGIIGVGEGSTNDLPNHLHGYLGLDPKAFHARAKPSFKLGVRFLWGERPNGYNYTFSHQVTQRDSLGRPVGYQAFENFDDLDIYSALMSRNLLFPRQKDGAPHVLRNFAYHIENADFVGWLEEETVRRGVAITDAKVTGVEPGPEGVGALRLDTGERVTADLFVDASGFRSELIGKFLKEPFTSFADSLFCDRAVAGGWERGADEPIQPHTTAETMEAGWCWRIEHEHHVNRGYVFSSSFLTDEQAEAEFRAKNPKAGKTRIVKFTSGRHRNCWVGNVFAVGNSMGFVEPLEATAILVICNTLRFLCDCLTGSGLRPTPSLKTAVNAMAGQIWDEIRDFLAVHYRFNTRLDNRFWRHCRSETALHGAEAIVQFYRENGPSALCSPAVITESRSIFQAEGFFAHLLGMKVPHDRMRPADDRDLLWRRQKEAELREKLTGALGVAETFRFLRHPGWNWTPGFFKW